MSLVPFDGKVMPAVNLETVDDDDLIEELAKRHAGGCFILWAEKPDSDGKTRRENYKGDASRLLGAALRIYKIWDRRTSKFDA